MTYPSARLERQAPFVKSLVDAHSRPRMREALLQHANKDQINALSDIVLNTLRHHVPLDPPLTARLRRYKKPLRDLSNRKASVTKRKNILLRQKGKGFWKGLQQVCQCVLPS